MDEAEAAIVRMIYTLYLDGHNGRSLGAKAIAYHLNQRDVTYRGSRWTRSRIHQILSETAYRGDYYFNRHHAKSGTRKPESEWIKAEVEPIVDAGTFDRAHARRSARAPAKVPPRVVNTPTLLTGLVKCGCCGAGMTLATGKGGRYRYYKCNTRIGKGTTYCTARNLPMEKLDAIVLGALADKVFTPKRTLAMLKALQRHLKDNRTAEESQAKQLAKELDQVGKGIERLYEAVEQGVLTANGTLKDRQHKLQARRQAILTEMAGLRNKAGLPAGLLRPKYIEAFTQSLRSKLFENRDFAKQYLGLLVDDIRVVAKQVEVRGSYAALAGAVAANGAGAGVPSFAPEWLPEAGKSNGMDAPYLKRHQGCQSGGATQPLN